MSQRKAKKVSYKEESDGEDMSQESEENNFEDIERKRITQASKSKRKV